MSEYMSKYGCDINNNCYLEFPTIYNFKMNIYKPSRDKSDIIYLILPPEFFFYKVINYTANVEILRNSNILDSDEF